MSNLILVVDDEAGIRDMLSLILRHRGYEVEAVGDLEAALEGMGRGRVSTALVDFFLPGVSGMDGIRRIRAMDPNLHLIVLTGAQLTAAELQEIEALDAQYQPKPFQIASLFQVLESELV